MQQSPESPPKSPKETFLEPKNYKELLGAFEQKERLPLGEKLKFKGVGNKDVYVQDDHIGNTLLNSMGVS